MIEKILIRVPAGIKNALQSEAKRLGISLNALILQILWDYNKKEEKT